MRWRYLFFLALVLPGCTIPTGPEYQQQQFPNLTAYEDIYLLTSPIPLINYDGIFSSECHKDDFLDSTIIDSFIWYNSGAIV